MAQIQSGLEGLNNNLIVCLAKNKRLQLQNSIQVRIKTNDDWYEKLITKNSLQYNYNE